MTTTPLTFKQATHQAVESLIERDFTTDDVYDVMASTTPEVFSEISRRAVISEIRRVLRQSTDSSGLPYAVSVDGHGTYVQTTLLEPSEFEFAVKQHCRLASQNLAKAHLLANLCYEVHGHYIDVQQLATDTQKRPLEAA